MKNFNGEGLASAENVSALRGMLHFRNAKGIKGGQTLDQFVHDILTNPGSVEFELDAGLRRAALAARAANLIQDNPPRRRGRIYDIVKKEIRAYPYILEASPLKK